MLKPILMGCAFSALISLPAFAQQTPAAGTPVTAGQAASHAMTPPPAGTSMGAMTMPSTSAASSSGATAAPTSPAASAPAAQPADGGGVNASANASPAPSNPVVVGATVKSQSGETLGTIDRLIAGADGYASGIALRRPDGSLHTVPISALGTTNGELVSTASAADIDAMRTM